MVVVVCVSEGEEEQSASKQIASGNHEQVRVKAQREYGAHVFIYLFGDCVLRDCVTL